VPRQTAADEGVETDQESLGDECRPVDVAAVKVTTIPAGSGKQVVPSVPNAEWLLAVRSEFLF
jgi:hypothetical protein